MDGHFQCPWDDCEGEIEVYWHDIGERVVCPTCSRSCCAIYEEYECADGEWYDCWYGIEAPAIRVSVHDLAERAS